jgi:DNA-3-methyladenine glycosylase I
MEKKRCPWLNLKNSTYVEYHDREWGRAVHDDRKHFEFLILEGAQAGLSWETVLKKRERYREVFADFDPINVARFSQKKIEKLLLDPGIIRNRLKVESAVSNSIAFLKVQKEFGSFDRYIWQFVGGKPIYNSFVSAKDYKTRTPESDALSKDLKARGFRFVGSTIIYAHMQACGLTQDHSRDCYLHGKKLKSL